MRAQSAFLLDIRHLSPTGKARQLWPGEFIQRRRGNGICTAIYNGSERVPESLNFCATSQSNFNKIFACESAGRLKMPPSWFVNLYQRSQPFQFFHLGALSFVAIGIADLAREEMSGRHFPYLNWPVEVFGAAFGLGILLGIALTFRLMNHF